MNIKNPEAHRLAVELAEMRGKTVTQAVTDALRTEVERERREARRESLAAELLEIGRRCAAAVAAAESRRDPGRRR